MGVSLATGCWTLLLMSAGATAYADCWMWALIVFGFERAVGGGDSRRRDTYDPSIIEIHITVFLCLYSMHCLSTRNMQIRVWDCVRGGAACTSCSLLPPCMQLPATNQYAISRQVLLWRRGTAARGGMPCMHWCDRRVRLHTPLVARLEGIIMLGVRHARRRFVC